MKYPRLFRLTTVSCLLLGAAFASSSVSSTANQPGATQPRNSAAAATQPLNPVATTALNNLQKSSRAEIVAQLSRQTGSYRFVRASRGVLAGSDSSAVASAERRSVGGGRVCARRGGKGAPRARCHRGRTSSHCAISAGEARRIPADRHGAGSHRLGTLGLARDGG